MADINTESTETSTTSVLPGVDFVKEGDAAFVIRPRYEDEFPISDDTPMSDYIRAREDGLRFVTLTEDGRVRETWNDWISCDLERVKHAKTLPANVRGEIPSIVFPPGMTGAANDHPSRSPSVIINERASTFDYSDDMPMDAFIRAREAKLNPRFAR